MQNGNGRWQLAFWIISSIAGIGLLTLTTNVVANDRIRQEEDKRIEYRIANLIEVNNNRYVQISGDLREIKAKMGIETSEYHGFVNARA